MQGPTTDPSLDEKAMTLRHPQAEYRQHRTVFEGQFAPGATIAQDGTIRTIIPVASAGRFRFRFKCTVTGILSAAFLSPGIAEGTLVKFENELDGTDPVSTSGNQADVEIAANTESVMEILDLCGEAYVLISFVEGDVAAGVVTYANYCQL